MTACLPPTVQRQKTYLLLGGDWHMTWQLLALPVDEGVPRSQNAIFPAQDVRGLLSLCAGSPCSSVGGMVPWEDTLLLALEHADGLVMVQLREKAKNSTGATWAEADVRTFR